MPTAAVAMTAPVYMQNAASGDLFEIQSSQLALQQSCDSTVRSLAQMLIADHTRMSNLMMQTAQSVGITPPPPQVAPHHMQMLQRLQMAGNGAAFDAAYKAEQIAAHQEALTLHRTYAEGGDVPPLRGVAAQAVPAIEMHLGQAQNLPTSTPCAPAPTTGRRVGERG
jgi:putative membrane protein